MRDYYEVLGLNKSAKEDDIKRAYRKLALKYHPDRNKEDGAEDSFKEVAEAYEVLKDPSKRQEYDQYGHSAPGRSRSSWGNINPEDIFSSFFGGNRRQKSNLDIAVNLTLEEILTGVEKQIPITRKDICSSCQGKGGRGPTCKTCQGHGKLRMQDGPFIATVPCNTCQGRGIQLQHKCDKCDRSGKVISSQTLSIKFPAGCDEGDIFPIRGEGGIEVPGMPRGDLHCHIRIHPHKVFHRKGSDLVMQHEISYADAIIGVEVDVPTLSGKTAKMKVPSGTQFGQVFRIAKQGLPGQRRMNMFSQAKIKEVGDQLVVISIKVPIKVPKKALDHLRSFEKMAGLANQNGV